MEVKGKIVAANSHALYTLTANQTTNVAVGDHVKFDVEFQEFGTDVSLDSTTAYVNTDNTDSIGRFLLQPGFYKIMASLNTIFSAAGVVYYGVYEVDTGVSIGAASSVLSVDRTNSGGAPHIAVAYAQPTTATRYEIRILSVSNFTTVKKFSASASTPASWVTIDQMV